MPIFERLYNQHILSWLFPRHEGVVLQQQKKGVPIGGFLSAQLMCLWALIWKYSFLELEDKGKFLAPVFHAWPAHIPQPQIKPGPILTFPFVAYVPKHRERFDDQGMHS